MKKVVVILAIVIVFLVSIKYSDEETIVIPNNAIRIRIIANSNSYSDQQEKLDVRYNLQVYLEELLEGAESSEEVSSLIKGNMLGIDNNIRTTLNDINSDTTYDVNYGSNYFPEKEFKGLTYNSGYYESLVVTLGDGKGDNWWCVLFPPLCLMETEEENIDEVEYELYVSEILNNYK